MRMSVALFLAFFASQALAAESAYTTLDLDRDCKKVGAEADSSELICKGYKDYPVHFAEGDLRQSIFYGHVGDWYQKGAFESFGPFNHAGPTIEWRIKDGRPYATIRRWFLSAGEDAAGKAKPDIQVLVVSRVAGKEDGGACVIGYVEATANANANELARKVADEDAHDFACRYSEPDWYGERRAKDVGDYRSFEEMPVE